MFWTQKLMLEDMLKLWSRVCLEATFRADSDWLVFCLDFLIFAMMVFTLTKPDGIAFNRAVFN